MVTTSDTSPIPTPPKDTCVRCNCVIQPFVTGMHKVVGGLLCDRCYFEDLHDAAVKQTIGR